MLLLKRSAFLLAGLFVVLALGLYSLDRYTMSQDAKFYETRPMLRAMSKVETLTPAEQWSDILFQRLPLGSGHSQAIKVFEDEGLLCESPKASRLDELLVCGASGPFLRWYVEVRFDANDKVSGGQVLKLKA